MTTLNMEMLRALIENRYTASDQRANERGRDFVVRYLREDSEGRKHNLRSISLREACQVLAPSVWRRIEESYRSGGGYVSLLESGTPTSLADFSNIVGQLIFNEVRDGFMREEYKFSRLVPTMESKISGTEKVPEITPIGDKADTVLEGEEYPTYGFGSAYYTLPAAVKKGMIVEVTEEAIFFDLTGRVAQAAMKIGLELGLLKEKSIIDEFIGQTNTYIRNGTATDNFLTSGAYTNASVIALVDETDIDEVEQAQNDILDPTTSEPVVLFDNARLFCVPALNRLATRIASAQQVRQISNSIETIAAPYKRGFDVVSSKLLYRRILAGPQSNTTKAQTWWFWGAIEEFMGWKENWALQGFSQGPDGPMAFSKDIPLRWKGRYRGVPFCREPRKMYRAGDAS